MNRTCVLFFFVICLTTLHGQQPHNVFIHPLIKEYFADRDTLSCMLVLRDQTATMSISSSDSKKEKTAQVYAALSTLADMTQQSLQDSLNTWQIPYHAFYIVNAIQVRLDTSTLKKIIDHPDIQSILPDFPLISLSEQMTPGDVRGMDTLLNWAINHIHADKVWGMGITGKGVVVGGLDTGTEWDHDFLLQNYRGNNENGQVNHNYNWYDGAHQINLLSRDSTSNSSNNPCGLFSAVPCDDNGHGTYTMGLMTGKYKNQYTGIAPGSKWISARVMERGQGRVSSYLSGLEWSLAPTDLYGNDPKPTLAPDILNNSWSCPQREGCVPENYWILDTAVVRLKQAGIFVVTSAGNDGRDGCSSIQNPLALFPSVFSVGATDKNDSITVFSSRGPVNYSSVIKPEVVAPGKDITSIFPGGKFQKSSGTSSSAPITAGVAALILEANPDLKGRPDLVRQILIKSAWAINENPCGESTSPNPVYGYGRVDALKAIQLAREFQPTSSLQTLSETAFSLHPNPFSDELRIISHIGSSAVVNIYDIRGQLYKSFRLEAYKNSELVVSDLQTGMYIVQIIAKEGILIRKMMKI